MNYGFKNLIFVAASTLVNALLATNVFADSAFNPRWQMGDSWRVRYTVYLVREVARETPAPRIPESFIYEYKVVSAPEPLSPLNEKSVVKIKVSPTTHRDSSWLLSFNPKTNTLISVTETYTNGASTTHANPYQNDSWMSGFGDFQGIIVDFARIPIPNQNEDRVIRQEPPSTAEFTQQTRFSNGTCQVTMTITEDPPAYTVVANIGWQQGKKWWTKASIKQGSQIEIAGELIE